LSFVFFVFFFSEKHTQRKKKMKIATKQGAVVVESAVAYSEFLSAMEGEVDLREAPVSKASLLSLSEYYAYYEGCAMTELPEKVTARMEDMVQPWYAHFISRFDEGELKELLVAADYLALKEVLQLGCAYIASRPREQVVSFLKK